MRTIAFITCSGANEFVDIEQIAALSKKYPVIEFGIQVSGKKCAANSARYWWLKALNNYVVEHKLPINLSLHLNQDWAEGFCDGDIPIPLLELLMMRDYENKLLFRRVQLNFKIGREKTPNIENLLKSVIIYSENERRFILPYNSSNEKIIKQLYFAGLSFDCLYDSSHGEGLCAETINAPVFVNNEILQGYAGGLSPDNIRTELDKIAKVVPENRAFYIDAEGKLKDNNGILSIEKCDKFVSNALDWLKTK